MITRRGEEVAMLVPASRRSRRPAREVVEHIRQTRKGARLPQGYSLRHLIEEGRRTNLETNSRQATSSLTRPANSTSQAALEQ